MDIDTFISLIPVGRKNAARLSELSAKTRLPQREVRRMVETVNKSGRRIVVNLSDGKGYFMADDSERNLERLYKVQEAKRYNSLKNKLEGMNRYLNTGKEKKESELHKNQISIFDFMGDEI